MSTNLLTPPTNSSPQAALRLSQAAPTFFKSQSGASLPYPLSVLTTPESQEKWQIYENIFLGCLRTGDNESAYLCLEELTDRFGKLNERVMALHGLYQEATATDDKALNEVLNQYDEILKDDPTIFSIRKRRAALLRSVGRLSDAVGALTNIVDSSPTDAEAWAELGDCYLTQGLYEQAVFCLEEVLLVMPNAWNMQARLGEVLFLSANKTEGGEQLKSMTEAMKRFCRSVELCDDYLRGFYGLKLTTNRLIPLLSGSSKSLKSLDSDFTPPSLQTVKKLNQLATTKLVEILRHSKSGGKSYDGYSEAELIATKELLDRDSSDISR